MLYSLYIPLILRIINYTLLVNNVCVRLQLHLIQMLIYLDDFYFCASANTSDATNCISIDIIVLIKYCRIAFILNCVIELWVRIQNAIGKIEIIKSFLYLTIIHSYVNILLKTVYI